MSSARANAAARNRRASTNSVSSVGGSATLKAPMSRSATPLPQQRQPQPQSRSASKPMQQAQPQAMKRRPQLSISDAIGLITLRLGRVENIVRHLQQESELDNRDDFSVCDGNSVNGNIMVESQVISDLVQRLAQVESCMSNSETVRQLQTELSENKKACASLQLSCLELHTQYMQLMRQTFPPAPVPAPVSAPISLNLEEKVEPVINASVPNV